MSKPHTPDRRTLLKLAGGASIVPFAGAVSTQEADAYDPGQQETAARYRETEHVKAFYRTNRYEGRKKD